MNFDIKTEQLDGDGHVIALSGEVDLYTAPEFKQQLLEVIGQGSKEVIVDFSNTTFIDSTTLGVLVGGVKRLRPNGLSVADLWDGDKRDKNAWVTVFRHHDNASAHKGPMGQFPETMWVLDFGNFERLYYDLVVLYRPWGPLTKEQRQQVRADLKAAAQTCGVTLPAKAGATS